QALRWFARAGDPTEHLSPFGSLVAADHPVLRQLVDNPARTRVADVELALHERHRRGPFGSDCARRASKQGVELALFPPLPLPLGAGALFEDLFHEARSAL